MQFHSDSERGLGPIVAGLSLGSPALMHFRLHAKHDPDRKGNAMSVVLRHVIFHIRYFLLPLNLAQGDVLVMEGIGVQNYYE